MMSPSGCPERRIILPGELDLYIDDGVEQQLRVCASKKLNKETSGVLRAPGDFNHQGCSSSPFHQRLRQQTAQIFGVYIADSLTIKDI